MPNAMMGSIVAMLRDSTVAPELSGELEIEPTVSNRARVLGSW